MELDDEEAPSEALKRMSIGDVRPREPSVDQYNPSSNQASPPTQKEVEQQDDEQGDH